MPAANDDKVAIVQSPGVLLRWLEVVLMFAVFFMFAAWPVPEPNEPHYLGKARHYWDTTWIEHDFFLDSADSHWAFYATTGWLSRWLPLSVFAWVGRAVTWAFLAFAWCRLSRALLPRPGAAVISAVLFVGLNENFHMAGEWVVGGFEAKGIAYALLIAALAELGRGRWNATWILLGGASALHVLVGGWSAIAVGICWLASRTDRPSLVSMAPGLAIGLVLSLAGVLPARRLTLGADAEVVRGANSIYVYERLPHHLWFFGIKTQFRTRFALLILAWLLVARFYIADPGANRIRRVVNATLLMVAIGIGLSWLARFRPDLAAGPLRFYWFRLADVMIPMGVTLAATMAAYQFAAAPAARWLRRAPALLGVAALFCLRRTRPSGSRRRCREPTSLARSGITPTGATRANGSRRTRQPTPGSSRRAMPRRSSGTQVAVRL